MESLNEELVKTDPYTALAEIYDVLMEHVDYAGWTDYIYALCANQGHSPENILECACGTGSFIVEFIKRGAASCTGFDISFEMVKAALEKLVSVSSDVKLFRGDMTAIPSGTKFDTVLCFYDSLNYLSTIKDVESALRNMWEMAEPDGVMIFDVSTENNSIRNFDRKNFAFNLENYICKRRSFYRKEDGIQITDIMITDKRDAKIYSERHFQYIYPLDQIEKIVEQLPGAKILLYNEYSFDPPDEDSERVHFLVLK